MANDSGCDEKDATVLLENASLSASHLNLPSFRQERVPDSVGRVILTAHKVAHYFEEIIHNGDDKGCQHISIYSVRKGFLTALGGVEWVHKGGGGISDLSRKEKLQKIIMAGIIYKEVRQIVIIAYTANSYIILCKKVIK